MSKTIDQRVVEMRFDNAQFERNVSTTMSTLAKLKQSLNLSGAAKGLDAVSAAANRCDMSGLRSGVEGLSLKFSSLQVMAVTCLARITNAAITAGKQIVSALTIEPVKAGFQEYETQINSIQTILANTQHEGTNLEQVNNALDTLNHYADKTIYNFTEMTRNIGTFTAAGVGLNESVSAIKGIANLAAVSGSTSHQASTAMYQLSQALATGTVKLMDWNSVVNAGMGGKVFQDALTRTAAVLAGSAEDVEGWRKANIESYGSFRDSLTEGAWLTTEVLTATLAQFTGDMTDAELRAQGFTEQQIADIQKMAQTANDAATKVKTFTQLFDTLKEAAQSGWTQTWEIIVGDFEEAKALLTSVSDYLNGVIGKSADARNELLQGWKDAGGRKDLIDALTNTFEGLLSIIEPIGEAFREIFPALKVEQLVGFTEGLKKLTEGFKLGETASENLKRTFKGIFAVFDILGQAISAVVKAIAPLFGHVVDLGGGILGLTAAIGDWLVKLSETTEKSGILNTIMQGIAKFVDAAVESIKKFVEVLKEKFAVPGLKVVEAIFGRIGDRAYSLENSVKSAFESIASAIDSSKIVDMLESIWNGAKTISKGIVDAFGALTEGIVDKISNADFSGLFDLINTGALGGIAIAIAKFLKSITEPLDGLNGIFESITGILDGVRGCFEAYQTQLKAGTLLKIASAIGILAAAILVISLIDSEKLSTSLGAITVLFADLMASMAIFGRVSTDLVGVTKACGAMIAISTAVLILASALKKIGELKFGEMATGLVGVIGLTTVVVTAAKAMSKNGPVIVKGAAQMIIFAAAIKILASVCEDLSKLSLEELAGGLIGVGVLMAAVSVFLNNTKFSGKAISTAVGVVVLAGAMKILASACADFGKMNWEDLGKGLAAIGGLLLEMAAFTKLTGNAQNIISISVGLIAISAAMKIFASAVKDFGQMNWEQLAGGLVGIAGALLSVALAVKIMPPNMISIGVGLIAVSAALTILAEVVTKMSHMSWEGLAKGLVALGGAIAILAVGLRAMAGTLAGSAALIVAAGALAILTPALINLSSMSWEGIAKGLVAVAGAFAVLGIAGAVLGPLVPSILGLAGAFTLIGVSVLAIGGGLMAAGVGLSALAAGFTALVGVGVAGATAIVSALTIIITGMANLIPMVVRQIGEAIIGICQVIAEGAPAIGEAVKAVVLSLVDVLVECVPAISEGALQLVMGVLAALVEYTPQIVDYIFQFLIGVLNSLAKNIPDLIQATVNVFMSYFSGVIDALKSIDTQTLVNGIAAIGLISAFMVALAAIAVLTPAAMVGVLGMGLVIAELSIVLAAIGALAQIPGLQWLINEGGKFLQSVGTAIGSFIGGIVGGFMSGISSQLPQIGSDLSTFMTNVQPFLEGAKNIDESVSNGIKALAEAILVLTAANILEGLTSWLTGGSSLSDFGKELAEFGPYFKAYADSVSGINAETVTASANAALALAEMASKLPDSGGVVGWFTGESSLSAFAQELAVFGPKLKAYADSVTGLDAGVVENSANAALALAKMAENLPNSGGVAGWFAGENSLSVFAAELAEFGPKLKQYADGLIGLDPNVVTNSANAAMALAEMANNLPNQGGVASWFAGDNTLSVFGAELAKFGPYLKEFADSVSGLDPNVVVNAANAAKTLAEVATALPNSGGVASWFAGDNTLSAFGKELADFGPKLKEFADSVNGIDSGQISNTINQVNRLVSMFKSMDGLDASVVSSFTTALANLGKVGVDSFVASFNNSHARVAQAARTLISTFVNAARANSSMLASSFANTVKNALTGINSSKSSFNRAGKELMMNFAAGIKTSNTALASELIKILGTTLAKINAKQPDFKTAGTNIVTNFANGISVKQSTIVTVFTNILNSALTSINNKYTSFYNAGSYLVSGFASGITANTFKAEAAAAAMAAAAYEAAKEELDINSPSKVFRDEIGSSVPEGTAVGIEQNTYMAADASAEMAKEVTNAAEDAFDEKVFEKEIGAMVSEGIAKGILSKSDKVKKAANKVFTKTTEASQKAYEASVKMVENRKEANNLSLIEELAAWKRIQAQYAKGTEERIEADKEVSRVQKELSEANEEYYNGVLTVQQETTEKRKELDEEYYEKNKEINNKLADDIQKLEDKYSDSLNSRSESLYKSYGLFDEVEAAETMNGKTLIKNLQSQIDAFDDWTTNLNELSEKIGVKELVAELQEMGVSSAKQIKALNNLTSEELDEYVKLWQQKHSLATKQARVELEDMSDAISREIYVLKDNADVELEANKKVWIDNIQALNDESGAKLEELKATWKEKVVGLTTDTESEFTKMADKVVAIIGERSKWSDAGANMVEGVLTGVVDNSSRLNVGVKDVMESALNAAKDALQINSPSKKFAELGKYSDIGFANGLEKFANKIVVSARDVGETAISALSRTISKISAAVQDGIDAQPTIRPVLDLSNVKSGVGKIDAMFSRTQALSVSAARNSSSKVEDQNGETASTGGNTYSFTQNNYSPKALSRLDIYRQTKNQFSVMKGLVKT